MKLSEVTPELKEALSNAYLTKLAAENTIRGLLKQIEYRNKTSALYRILGLCPQCGKCAPAPNMFYCAKCRADMTRRNNKRYRDKHPKYPQAD
jgi:hypothetical protein